MGKLLFNFTLFVILLFKKVVQLFRNQTNEWYHIQVNGEEIICTGGHPFYVAELDKFIPARELAIGTKLLLSTGVCAIIEALQVEQLEAPETTNFFFVLNSTLKSCNDLPKNGG